MIRTLCFLALDRVISSRDIHNNNIHKVNKTLLAWGMTKWLCCCCCKIETCWIINTTILSYLWHHMNISRCNLAAVTVTVHWRHPSTALLWSKAQMLDTHSVHSTDTPVRHTWLLYANFCSHYYLRVDYPSFPWTHSRERRCPHKQTR